MSVTIPTDLCDCGDEPRRGLTARKHMTMCRYGIIEEWESYRPAEAAPPLDGLREALRDFMALLPPERWALLRPATQATIDTLGGPRIGAGKRLWAESLIRGRNER